MFFRKIKREHELVRAFQKLFLGQGGRLKPEAAVVLEFLRDEARPGRNSATAAHRIFMTRRIVLIRTRRRLFSENGGFLI